MEFDEIAKYMGELDEENLFRCIKSIMNNHEIMDMELSSIIGACQEGMKDVGERYEKGEYLVGELIFSGELICEVIELLKPYMPTNNWKNY